MDSLDNPSSFIELSLVNNNLEIEMKGISDPSHFIFEINVGKRRIRHTTTLKLIDEFLDRLKID